MPPGTGTSSATRFAARMACMPACLPMQRRLVLNALRPLWRMLICTAFQNIAAEWPREPDADSLPHGACRFSGAHTEVQFSGDPRRGLVSGLCRGNGEGLDRGRQRLSWRLQLSVDRRAYGSVLLHISIAGRVLYREKLRRTRPGHASGADSRSYPDAQGVLHHSEGAEQFRCPGMHGAGAHARCFRYATLCRRRVRVLPLEIMGALSFACAAHDAAYREHGCSVRDHSRLARRLRECGLFLFVD